MAVKVCLLNKITFVVVGDIYSRHMFPTLGTSQCIVGCLLFVIDIEVGPGQATIRLYHIYIKTRCLCSIVKLPIEMAGCQFDRRQYFLPILTNYRTRGQIILITPSSFLLRMPGFTVRKIGCSDSILPILTATTTNVCYYTQAEKVMKTYHMLSLLSLLSLWGK